MNWKNIGITQKIYRIDMKAKSPYEILRIAPSASVEEVHKAYRQLIKVYHPDVADRFLKKNNEEITRLINSAYEEVLKERNEQR